MYWLFTLFVAWVVLAFVLPYFFLPYIRKEPLPTRFPRELEEACAQLARQHETPFEYIKYAVVYVLSQNSSSRWQGLVRVREAFESDVRVLLRKSGFMHSHHLCYLVRVLLSKSPFFSDAEDIRMRYTLLNLRIHPYLQVRVAGQWFDVDVAGRWWGVSLGSHAWGFR
jgi:hypothetical protein